VHFGHAPIAFSSAIFDCAFGRISRLPPDCDGDEDVKSATESLMQLRTARGDAWARSELLDWLRRLRQADPMKEASYRWMLAQRGGAPNRDAAADGDGSVFTISADTLQTVDAMLEPPSYRYLLQNSNAAPDGSVTHNGAVLEWALLWDVYLKYLGSGDRWLAYEALTDGLTVRGRRRDLWATVAGDDIVEALEGTSLTPDVVLANLEFKPAYGYEQQFQCFRRVMESFSPEELSMFLRFATGVGRLPASQRFPGGQKLTIRFMPDDLEHLPVAKTCIWVVDIPPYEDDVNMGQKLRQAIASPQPFLHS